MSGCGNPKRPAGAAAVMARRRWPIADALDFFPTPPWATRALVEHVIANRFGSPRFWTAWEPAAGEGHMAEVLAEYFARVHASDVHDYGRGYDVGSFIGDGPDIAGCHRPPHWIITNPPFVRALDFALRAIAEAEIGTALLVRSAWAEGEERYRRLFASRPPAIIAQFVERVPLVEGRWDPHASSATSYAWFVWAARPLRTEHIWIPPGRRDALTRPDDVRRFCAAAPAPLLEGAEL